MSRLAAVVVSMAVGGCGDVHLVDPLETNVALAGAVFEVGATVSPRAARLDFRGHAYGYELSNDRIVLRYLDAGQMIVAGRPAGRRFVRVGQPEYVLRAPVDVMPSEVAVWVDGSGRVPPCGLAVALPRAEGPPNGAIVYRTEGVVVSLPGVPDSLRAGDRVYAVVRMVSAIGIEQSLTLAPLRTEHGPALVVRPDALQGIPSGPVELTITVVRERTHGFTREESCAPSLVTVATYEATSGIHLR